MTDNFQMINGVCIKCGSPILPIVRWEKFGYKICKQCGELEARKEKVKKGRRSAPLFNKGGYQYITSKNVIRDIGRSTNDGQDD